MDGLQVGVGEIGSHLQEGEGGKAGIQSPPTTRITGCPENAARNTSQVIPAISALKEGTAEFRIPNAFLNPKSPLVNLVVKKCTEFLYLADSLLLLQGLLGQLLPLNLHRESYNILPANGYQLLGLSERERESGIRPPAPRTCRRRTEESASHLSDLLLVVHHQQRHAEQDGAELLHGLLKFASRGELVAQLQALDQVIEFQANGREGILQASFFPGGTELRWGGTNRTTAEASKNTHVVSSTVTCQKHFEPRATLVFLAISLAQKTSMLP